MRLVAMVRLEFDPQEGQTPEQTVEEMRRDITEFLNAGEVYDGGVNATLEGTVRPTGG